MSRSSSHPRRAPVHASRKAGTARSATGWPGASPGRRPFTEPGSPFASASRPTRSRWRPWLPVCAERRRSARARERGSCSASSLLHLGFWLDHVDGQVARWRGTVSLDGVYLDYLMHHLVNLALGFALGYGLCLRLGQSGLGLAGFAIAAGWTFLACTTIAATRRFSSVSRAPRRPTRSMAAAAAGPSPRPLAPAGPGRPDLAGVQAVRAARGACWLDRPGGPGGGSALRSGRRAGVLGVPGMALLAPAWAWPASAERSRGEAIEAEFARWFQPGTIHSGSAAAPADVSPHPAERPGTRRRDMPTE